MLRRLALLLLFAPAALAQQPVDPGVRPVTQVTAITDARVVQAPGRVLDRATVVLRDGRIEAVGPNVAVPFDADVIEGDSLVVYAGFIDALAFTGVTAPAVDTDARVEVPDTPPRDRAGIRPDVRAVNHLDPSASGLEGRRNAGFTALHVAPSAGMIPGQGAVIRARGDRAEALVLRPTGGLVMRWQTAAGVRPSTPMGIAAVLRQLYRRSAEHAEAPQGYDAALDALRPSQQRNQAVFFVANDLNEAHRALALSDELGLNAHLVGAPEAPLLLGRLAGRTVVLPLVLPDAVEADTTEALGPDELLAAHIAGEIFRTERRTVSHRDVEGETPGLEARRRAAVLRTERTARTLHEAGVRFAFASLDASPGTIRATLRRIVEAGLPADAALAALTTTPAALLGVEAQLGTVEPGRLAHLVVTDGDVFAEDTALRFVFVDGERFELDDAAPSADPNAEMDPTGAWRVSLDTPEGAFSGTMTIEGTEGNWTGSLRLGDLGTYTLDRIAREGNRLTYRILGTPAGDAEAEVVVDGNRLSGSVSLGAMGSAPISGTRPGFMNR